MNLYFVQFFRTPTTSFLLDTNIFHRTTTLLNVIPRLAWGRAADHSPPSSAAVMEEYSYTSTHPLGHTGPVTGSLYLSLFNILYLDNSRSLL